MLHPAEIKYCLRRHLSPTSLSLASGTLTAVSHRNYLKGTTVLPERCYPGSKREHAALWNCPGSCGLQRANTPVGHLILTPFLNEKGCDDLKSQVLIIGLDISLAGHHPWQLWYLPPYFPTPSASWSVYPQWLSGQTNIHHLLQHLAFPEGGKGGSFNFHPILAYLVWREWKPKVCKGVGELRLFSDSPNVVCFLRKQVWRGLFCCVPGTQFCPTGWLAFGSLDMGCVFSRNREVFWTAWKGQVFVRLKPGVCCNMSHTLL